MSAPRKGPRKLRAPEQPTGAINAAKGTDMGTETLTEAPVEIGDGFAGDEPPGSEASPTGVRVRAGTKQATLIEMMSRDGGATLREICGATGWNAATARGAIWGQVAKRLGLQVTGTDEPERGNVYRIPK